MNVCGQEKSWSDIDTELHTAGYPGPFDHSDHEMQVYKSDATFCKGDQGNPQPQPQPRPVGTSGGLNQIFAQIQANPLPFGLAFIAGYLVAKK